MNKREATIDPWNVPTIPIERRTFDRRSEFRMENPGRRSDDTREYLERVWMRETRGGKGAE